MSTRRRLRSGEHYAQYVPVHGVFPLGKWRGADLYVSPHVIDGNKVGRLFAKHRHIVSMWTDDVNKDSKEVFQIAYERALVGGYVS